MTYSTQHAKLINKLQQPGELDQADREALVRILQTNGTEKPGIMSLQQSLCEIGNEEVDGANWNELTYNCFAKIGKGLGADRISYYEYAVHQAARKPGFNLEVQWQAGSPVKKVKQNKRYPFLEKSRYAEISAAVDDFEPFQSVFDRQKMGPLKKLMKDENVSSLLILPVKSGDSVYGIVRFDDCKVERIWTADEISLLQVMVFHLRNILEKRDLEVQVQNVYRQAKIGTWEMNLEDGSFNWSPVTKEIFELDRDAKPTKELAMSIFYDDESRKKLMQSLERAQITGEPYDMELPVLTAKGNVKWVRDTCQAQFKNGKCVRLYGIVQDINDRKLTEFESEKNKKLLEAITRQTDVAVWVRDDSGKIIFVNNQWKHIFGLDDVRVVGQSLTDLFEKKEADEMTSSDRDVIRNQQQVVFEEHISTAKGQRYYMVNKFPLDGAAGLKNAVGGIGTDITKIKETEEKLHRAEQKLLEIIEHSTILFYTHDTNHRLTYLSPQSIDFLGYPPEEARKRWVEFVTDHPANKKGFEHTQRAIDTGKAQPPFELQLKRGDGEIIWVEVNEAPVIKDGKTISIAGSLTDITERKEAQEKIRSSLHEKETLLAEIHHRVKNNLAVVASLMQLQAMESSSEELREQLIESVLRIKSMAGIHEHLYKTEDFARLDFSHNLKVLVEEIINTMQYSASIKLNFNCDDVFLSVNQAIPCSLVVNEVITNIIKHGFMGRDHGNIWVELSCEGEEVACGKVSLAIRDDGVGFPEDFDPVSTNTLGMQLIKTLSEQLFGAYQFESLAEGAAFCLEFEKKADSSLP